MYLVAQRVVSPLQSEGLNAFYYSNGSLVWQGLPPLGIPDQDPGELIDAIVAIPPPGNRVRGFLDIVAPDEVEWHEIHNAFVTFLAETRRENLPWTGLVGRCLFGTNMDEQLARNWQSEIAGLYAATQSIYRRVREGAAKERSPQG
jgi:hypothetical protein